MCTEYYNKVVNLSKAVDGKELKKNTVNAMQPPRLDIFNSQIAGDPFKCTEYVSPKPKNRKRSHKSINDKENDVPIRRLRKVEPSKALLILNDYPSSDSSEDNSSSKSDPDYFPSNNVPLPSPPKRRKVVEVATPGSSSPQSSTIFPKKVIPAVIKAGRRVKAGKRTSKLRCNPLLQTDHNAAGGDNLAKSKEGDESFHPSYSGDTNAAKPVKLEPGESPKVEPPIASTSRPLKAMPKASLPKADKPKKQKNCVSDIPENPLEFTVTDEKGGDVKFGTAEFNHLFGKTEKHIAATTKAYNAEFKRWLRFSKSRKGEEWTTRMLASQIDPVLVSEVLAVYIQSRINLTAWKDFGRKQYLDTSTMDLSFAKLVAVFKRDTEYDLWSPSFLSAREAKQVYMKKAKQQAGLGMLSNQHEPLSRAMICYLLHSDLVNLYTPQGLTWAFFWLFVLIFLPRVRTETYNVKRGDFHIIKNTDGTAKCVVYTPHGQLKRDRGHVRGDHAAAVMKRPIAIPCRNEPKLSFDTILETWFCHLDQLEWSGDRADQPMFHQLRTSPKLGECFFLPKKMGIDSFDMLLRKLIWSCGLKVGPLQFQNQCLRPTAFGYVLKLYCIYTSLSTSNFRFHKKLNLSTGLFMAMAGHASARTHLTYARKNPDLLMGVTRTFQVCYHCTSSQISLQS